MTDLFALTPATTDLRHQRSAVQLLGTLIDRTQRKQLPPMDWRITSTGNLIGEVFWHDAETARRIFEIWTTELGLRAEPERTSHGDRRLRAAGPGPGGIHLIVEAQLYGSDEDVRE